MDLSVTAVVLATILSLSVKNATVIRLARWTIHVGPPVSVGAIKTMLDLDATNVLQLISAIPTACLVSVLPMVPTRTHVSQQ